MLLFFAPVAFAASGDVVLCLEVDGQTSFERSIGEGCTAFATEISDIKNTATAQHCSQCTDYALSDSALRSKATLDESSSKAAQKLIVAEYALTRGPYLSGSSLLSKNPHLLRVSITLAQLRTVIIRV